MKQTAYLADIIIILHFSGIVRKAIALKMQDFISLFTNSHEILLRT